MSDVCTYKLLKRLIPDKPGIEVSTCTRSIDQSMKPAVKMLHQKFRCKQRIIRSQETEKLPPLLFPALVVEFFCSSRSAQYEGSLQLSSNRSIAPSCFANRVQPPLEFCNVCFKVKVASTALLICANCRKKTCLRCGKRDQVRAIICNSSVLGLTVAIFIVLG